MKVYAIAGWLLGSLDKETLIKARDDIAKNGVYSAFHGNWWVRLTRSRGELHGQINDVGIGARTQLMENSLHIKLPQAHFEGLVARMPNQGLTLDQIIEAKGIPRLVAINARFDRVGQFAFASQWSMVEEEDLWNRSQKEQGHDALP